MSEYMSNADLDEAAFECVREGDPDGVRDVLSEFASRLNPPHSEVTVLGFDPSKPRYETMAVCAWHRVALAQRQRDRHYDGVRARERAEAEARRPRPFVGPPVPPPEVPVPFDGIEGEWFPTNTIRSLSESAFGLEPLTQRVLDSVRARHRLRPNQKFGVRGTVITGEPKVDSVGLPIQPQERAGFGERDRDFRNLDLRAVQFEADEWDYTLAAGNRRYVSEFHDLLAHMNEVPFETEPSVVWNQEREVVHDEHGAHDTGFWVPARWTLAALAKRLCTYRWNDDFFVKRRIPIHAWAGLVHEGSFVYLGDSVYAACIARWMTEAERKRVEAASSAGRRVDPRWTYTVFWRESVGWEESTNGRSYRAWVYHHSRSFTSLDRPSLLDRQGAMAFALRLEAKAVLEAELLNDLRESMGEKVQRNWNHDEYSYAPEWLPFLAGEHSWSDEH